MPKLSNVLRLFPALTLLFLAPARASEQRGGVERLRDVRSVYVVELGQTERARALRQEIIRSLADSKRVRVVDAPGEADAVLRASVKRGSKNVDRPIEIFGGDDIVRHRSVVVPTEQVVFRLDSGRSRALWAYKLDTEAPSDGDERRAARDLADKLSREFLKAVEKDGRRRR